jgi:hypothetical protein
VTTFIRLTSSRFIDGFAHVSHRWHELDGTERLDLLQDWIGLLNEMHDAEYYAQHGGDYTPHETCLKAIKYEPRR